MTTFWLLAAALTLIALVLIVPVLIRTSANRATVNRRDQNILIAKDRLRELENEFQRGSLSQQDYEQAKDELEQGLFSDMSGGEDSSQGEKNPAWITAVVVALIIPGLSFLLYSYLGNPKAVEFALVQADPEAGMQAMITQLEARLEKDPSDIDGWLMLGRTHMEEENFAKAEAVYDRLLKIEPESPDYMLLKADALAMKSGGRIIGEPEALILAALEKDPNNVTGLWLAGMAARDKGDKETALQHWNKLRGILPAGSQDLASLEQLIAQLNNDAPAVADQHIADIESMVSGLEEKLKSNPDNPTGWLMLGRSYLLMKRFPEAVTALEEALKQNSGDPTTMLALADATAMSNGGRMYGRPSELVEAVLVKSPENPKALWLAGMAERERGNNDKAITHWQKLLPLLAEDPASADEVKSLILQAGGTIPEQTAGKEGTASVSVSVNLDEKLAASVNPQDTVFIYVKAFQGPPMPLAAARIQVKDLPLTLTLDDSMGMMPQLKMSDHEQLIVGARISQSGQAIAAKGDLFTELGPVKHGDNVELKIDQIVQ